MATTSKSFPNKTVESSDEKRRRKTDLDCIDSLPKSIILPQKKRALPSSSQSGSSSISPMKKCQKVVSSSSDENTAADETLIRETEAALKNLSGSWPGRYNPNPKQEQSPAFENLFDEKKTNVKLSPSSSSNSSNNDNNACSLKDMITLRDQHEESIISEEKSLIELKTTKSIKIKQETNPELSTDDNSTSYSMDKHHQRSRSTIKCESAAQPPHYESPDFNELVDDDSSNELEIDMSESASEKNDAIINDKPSDTTRSIRNTNTKSSGKYENPSSIYQSFSRPASSPFSTTSAFRPLQPATTKTSLTNLGPLPAEATFVGYPTVLGVESSNNINTAGNDDNDDDDIDNNKSKNVMTQLTTPTIISVDATQIESVVEKSPEPANKQYTILQPASVGSRAASALQEVAREGVLSVSAISSSSSGSSNDSVKMISPTTITTVPGGTLSPNSMSRGKLKSILLLLWYYL